MGNLRHMCVTHDVGPCAKGDEQHAEVNEQHATVARPAAALHDHSEAVEDSMAEHDAIVKAKYGGLMPKNPAVAMLMRQKMPGFDSADWAMEQSKGGPGTQEPELLDAHPEAVLEHAALEAYLDRIGLGHEIGRLQPCVRDLHILMRAHAAAIPFENLS